MADQRVLDGKWAQLKVVSDLLRDEEDAQGRVKSGEGDGLNRIKKELQRDLAGEATKLLKQSGFNGWGLKRGKRRPGL